MENLVKQTFYIDPETGRVVSEKSEYVSDILITESNRKNSCGRYGAHGNFAWCLHPILKEYFPDMKGSYITRIMFIATYTRNNGCLMDCHRQPLTYSQIRELTGLCTSEFSVFWNYLLSNGIVKKQDDGFYMDKDKTFFRGGVSGWKVNALLDNKVYMTRLFIHQMREVYHNCKHKMHTPVSYVFKLIPYLNREYNIVCRNPFEKKLSKIKPLTPNEICDVIGYDNRNFPRIMGYLKDIKITVKNMPQSIIKYVDEIKGVVVNPDLVYAGNRWDEIEELAKFQEVTQ